MHITHRKEECVTHYTTLLYVLHVYVMKRYARYIINIILCILFRIEQYVYNIYMYIILKNNCFLKIRNFYDFDEKFVF